MGTTSEGTEGYVKEDIQPKRVIGFLYLTLARWYEIILCKYKHTERVEGLPRSDK